VTADATILIPARNAARTIQRAVRSAVAQAPASIVLIDDFSSDDTAPLARAIAPDIVVVQPREHRTVGLARDVGIHAAAAPFAVWLDADDELLPGRAARLVGSLQRAGAHIAADAVELVDGASGARLGEAPIPDFLKAAPVRLFERNYLPGSGVIAVRTDFAQRIGYDHALHGPEDVDFLLRGLTAGARFSFVDEPGYRVYAYPGSLSRNLAAQRRMYATLLRKHAYDDVRALYRRAGCLQPTSAWALASMAIFREEYATALEFVEEAAAGADPCEVLEPDGPCPRPERWRVDFHTGSLRLLMDDPEGAASRLAAAESRTPTAEGANNLGVARARLGDPAGARACFEAALQRFAGYADARVNLGSRTPDRITTHPLRVHRARADY
jgi:glycosyltransferase involved in cell wall biosynthesis